MGGGLGRGTVRWGGERGDARWSWIVGVAVLAALFVFALWLVRGAVAANAVAAALIPAALLRALPAPSGRAVYLGVGRAALVAAVMLNPLTLIAIGAAGARVVETASG